MPQLSLTGKPHHHYMTPFCFISSFVLPIIQHYKQRTVQEAPLQSIQLLQKVLKLNKHPDYQLLGSEQLFQFVFQVCSTCYTVLQTNNITRRVSAIYPLAMEITDDSRNSHHALPQINTFEAVEKEIGHKG